MKTFFWTLSRTKKALLVVFMLGIVASLSGLTTAFHREHSISFPAEGGTMTVGAVANIEPNFLLNPLLVVGNAKATSIEADICRLVFAGLMRFDAKTGEIVDHVADHTLSRDKRVYTFTIKPGLTWHDGHPLSAADIVFTYQTMIQGENFANTFLSDALNGVEIEQISEDTVTFTLPEPYKFFLTNFTIGLLPEHLLSSSFPDRIQFEEFNFNPVGLGPYRFSRVSSEEDILKSTITLEAFPEYISGKPKIETVEFQLFPNADLLVRNISGLDTLHPKLKSQYDFLSGNNSFELVDFTTPQYVAVFINMDSEKFKGADQQKMRLALQLATDKDAILSAIPGERIDTPLLETNLTEWLYEFSPDNANGALKDSGWIFPENEGDIVLNDENEATTQDTEATDEEVPNEEEESDPQTPATESDESEGLQTLSYISEPSNQKEFWTQSEGEWLVGNVPEGTRAVEVNGYRLQRFNAAKGTFSYRLETNIGTLRSGRNEYRVEFLRSDGTLIDAETAIIHLGERPDEDPLSDTNEESPEQTENLDEDPESSEEENSIESESGDSENTELEENETDSSQDLSEQTPEESLVEPTLPQENIPDTIRRNANGEPLKLRMVTIDQPSFYPQTAQMLKEQWEQVGIMLDIEILESEAFFTKAVEEKDYDLVLYGQNLGYDLDAFSFWHSSQVGSGGNNLSKYQNFEASVLLKEIRRTHDEELRKNKLAQLREIIKNDVPAVFLFSPYYTLPISQKVKEESVQHLSLFPDRFSNIETWYIRESRSFHPDTNWMGFVPWFFRSISELSQDTDVTTPDSIEEIELDVIDPAEENIS